MARLHELSSPQRQEAEAVSRSSAPEETILMALPASQSIVSGVAKTHVDYLESDNFT
jgi:hypothetical protein